MEETRWLTKTKIIILLMLILITGLFIGYLVIHKNNLRKEYMNFEDQLEYAAPNYLLKEKITIKENEWREINIVDILKQKLLTNKRASDCEGYVIATGNKNDTIEETEEESQISNNINYKAYIKCKKIYTTNGYGTRPTTGLKNNTQPQTEKDTEKPTIELFGDATIKLEVGDVYKELGAIATDNIDGDITNKIKTTGEVDTSKEGTYTIKYSVVDTSGNKQTSTRTIIVSKKKEEEKKPINSGSTTPSNSGSTTPSTTPSNSGSTTPTTPTKPSTPTPQQNTDKTAPIITFNDNSLYQNVCSGNKVNISVNGPYGYVARDNVDGNITSKVIVSGDIGTISRTGIYTVNYRVTDNAGNTTTASRKFTVKDCSSSTDVTTISVTEIRLNYTSRTLKVGQNTIITYAILPSNATNKTVTFQSSNPNVATVDSYGVVVAKSSGTTIITLKSNNGKRASCTITVK